MKEKIDDILHDVKLLLEHHTDPDQYHGLMARIRIGCEALVGIDRAPDTGPWQVSKDGRTVQSDCFDHDVVLEVTGDFYGDSDRLVYSTRLAQQLNQAITLKTGLPKVPPLAVLHHMAMRHRHDFGLLSKEQQEPILVMMRQLYEEVSGHGFHRWG